MRTRNRKLLAVFLTIALIVSLFTGLTVSVNADYTPTGTMTSLWNSGNPTSASIGTVYSISSETELGYLASYVATSGMNTSGVTFYLTQGFSINGMTWAAIGTELLPFEGTFDGCDETLTWTGTATANTSRRTVSDYFGIFGYNSSSGVVKNLTVAGSLYLKGNDADFISTAVAYNAGLIDHITNNAVLDSNGTSVFSVGGVAGGNARFVLNSQNSAVITAYRKVGGIVGTNAGTSSAHAVINSCSNVGAITATYASKNGVGGIAGFAGDTDGTQYSDIWNCYNQGTITCYDGNSYGKWIGGIVGFENNKSKCINCYNTGNLVGNSYRDHISGKTEGINTNCYGLNTITAAEGYDGAILKTSAQMTDSGFAAVVGAGSTARWNLNVPGYPTLKYNAATGDVAPTSTGNITVAIASMPYTTTYNVGDQLDLTGLVVTVSVNGGSPVIVTDYETNPVDGAVLTASNTSVVISGEYQQQAYSITFYIVVINSNEVYLDVINGDDSTAEVGDYQHPFATIDAAVTAAGTGGTVYIMNTVTFNSATTNNSNVTFKRYSGLSSSSALFTVSSGTVTMTTMMVDGNGSGPLFNVTGGSLILKGGITLQNCATGVNVSSGSLTVNKATITASSNSVVVGSSGSFTIKNYGGISISGPVYLSTGKTITVKEPLSGYDAVPKMTVECQTPSDSTTVASTVAMIGEAHTFTLLDAFRIDYVNASYGVKLDHDVLVLATPVYLNGSSGSDSNGGTSASDAVKTISRAKSLGSFIYVCGLTELDGITLSGGSIFKRAPGYTGSMFTVVRGTGTLASDAIGGSGSGTVVAVSGGTFDMTGGYIVGGKVNVVGGEFKLEGGKLTDGEGTNGGAVYVGSSAVNTTTGKLTMSGGTITGNTATNGGAVYLAAGTFTMSGGTITGNTASGYGAGVYMENGATFNLGCSGIATDQVIFLVNPSTSSNGAIISITAALASAIKVEMAHPYNGRYVARASTTDIQTACIGKILSNDSNFTVVTGASRYFKLQNA